MAGPEDVGVYRGIIMDSRSFFMISRPHRRQFANEIRNARKLVTQGLDDLYEAIQEVNRKYPDMLSVSWGTYTLLSDPLENYIRVLEGSLLMGRFHSEYELSFGRPEEDA